MLRPVGCARQQLGRNGKNEMTLAPLLSYFCHSQAAFTENSAPCQNDPFRGASALSNWTSEADKPQLRPPLQTYSAIFHHVPFSLSPSWLVLGYPHSAVSKSRMRERCYPMPRAMGSGHRSTEAGGPWDTDLRRRPVEQASSCSIPPVYQRWRLWPGIRSPEKSGNNWLIIPPSLRGFFTQWPFNRISHCDTDPLQRATCQ